MSRRSSLEFDKEEIESLSRIFNLWYKNRNNLRLDNKSIELLRFFAYEPICSAYSCHKYLNNNLKIKISYKNIFNKIKRLDELGFITENEIDKSGNPIRGKHGVINYKLTEYGIFYVLTKKVVVNDYLEMHPEIIFNYENFPIYKNILYQYIQLNNIKKFKSPIIIYSLIKYVENCFLVLESFFREISRREFDLNSIERIGGILRNLHRDFKLEVQIGKQTTIVKASDFAKDEEKVRSAQTREELILNQKGEKVLKIINKRDDRILYMRIIQDNKEKILQVGRSDPSDGYYRLHEIDIKSESTIENFTNTYFPISMIEYIKRCYDIRYAMEMLDNLKQFVLNVLSIDHENISKSDLAYQDLRLLRQDLMFLQLFHKIGNHMNRIFNTFVKLNP